MNGEDLLRLNRTSGNLSGRSISGLGYVNVTYVITNSRSISAEVDVEFSVDNGITWSRCPLKKGHKRYASGPEGRQHSVAWNTVKSFGRRSVSGLVRLRIDGEPTKAYSTFSVNNEKAKRGLLATIFG